MAASQAADTLVSMTGFGRGSAENKWALAEVELRSVNGKGLHLKLRLPSDRLELEPECEAKLRARLERGSVNGQLRLRLLGSQVAIPDREALAVHLAEWRKTQKALGLAANDPSLSELLALPGAFTHRAEESKVTKAVRQACLAAVDEALESLVQSRSSEGRKLHREFKSLLRKFRAALARTEKRLPKALAELQTRYQARLAESMAHLEENEPLDLARELIVLADRADVREEVARLHIHLERMDELIAQGGAIGREFEFVLQEVHREVTTLGNKSSDQQLSEQVVAMKLLAGQLKEQSANLE